MGRGIHRLSAAKVAKTAKPGRYGDGGGLWLQVGPAGTKSWLLRYMIDGRARQMGLGPVHTVGLADARDQATACRRQLLDGIDPLDAKHAARAEARINGAKAMTFGQCAEAYIKAHRPSWRNAVHAKQWQSTLDSYAAPVIGDLSVAAIDVGHVMKVVEPLWSTKTETASRVRGRIELVLDWATARGYRRGDNPARWRGHLDKLLPARTKVRQVKHHAALPYTEAPAFMADLRGREGTGARALEFAILTAARTGEVVAAKWEEIDGKVWTVPAERMKAHREHKVPLPARALEILDALPREGGFVFPGARAGKPLSNMALLATLRRMERGDLTAHGFRSTFRDWAAEQTSFPAEVAEMALAHTVGDKVEAAYRRGDLFAKRGRLMDAWAKFCTTAPRQAGDVVSIRA